MKDSYIPILALSMLSLLFIGRFKGPRDWVQALYKHPGTSLFLIVLLGSTFLGGSREEGAESMIDGVRLVRMIILIMVFFISSFTLLRSTKSLSMAGTAASLMLCYGLYAMLSSVYSPLPFLTLWKGFEVVALVLAMITIASKIKNINDLEWLINILLVFMLFLVITVLVGAVVDPANAFRNLMEAGNAEDAIGQRTAAISMLRGVAPALHPAAAGGIAGFTAIAAIIKLLANDKKTKLGFLIVAALSFTTIILIQSRTGIFAISSAIIAILILKRYTLYAVLLGVPVGLVVVFSAVSDSITSYMYRGQTEEQFSSMSGRVDFWKIVIEKFYESPLIGHGYYASHRFIFGTSGVDNTYLSVALGVGFLGFFIFISAFIIGMITHIKNWPSKQSSHLYTEIWMLLTGLSIITFVRSIVGTSFETFYYMLFVYMILQISIFSLTRFKNINQINADVQEAEESEIKPASLKSRRILSRRKTK